jgi:hypothetical protein
LGQDHAGRPNFLRVFLQLFFSKLEFLFSKPWKRVFPPVFERFWPDPKPKVPESRPNSLLSSWKKLGDGATGHAKKDGAVARLKVWTPEFPVYYFLF